MAMELRGSLNLSKFERKPNQPKYYGKCLIKGVEYRLKGWEKVRQDTGEVWISLLFEDPEAEAERLAEEFAPEPKPAKKRSYIQGELELEDGDPF